LGDEVVVAVAFDLVEGLVEGALVVAPQATAADGPAAGGVEALADRVVLADRKGLVAAEGTNPLASGSDSDAQLQLEVLRNAGNHNGRLPLGAGSPAFSAMWRE
jgi:hypothetical protein